MARIICITIYDGDTEKTILRSGVLAHLKAQGHTIILCVRGGYREEHYRRSFEDAQTKVVVLPEAQTFAERLWYQFGWSSVPTHSAYLRRSIKLHQGGSWFRYAVETVAWLLGHSRFWRECVRFVYLNIPDSYGRDVFTTYKPDVLFAPNMFSPMDFRLMRLAKKLGVPTITTAKSWDVLTTKAFTRVKADRILVYNTVNKQEAVAIGDYSPESVEITGFPQFDIYLRDEWKESRASFCSRIGLDPSRRIILFAVPGDWKTPYTKDILHALDQRISAGMFEQPIQVLARLHPKYPDSSELEHFENIILNRPGTILNQKKEFSIDMGIGGTYAWTFTDTDIAHLANSIFHSDIVINTESTLTLDASVFDKPVILIGYDGKRQVSYWDSVERIYEREHYQHIIQTGAAPLVKNDDELAAAITHFLADPGFLLRERQELKQKMLYTCDGRAAERTAHAVLAMFPS